MYFEDWLKHASLEEMARVYQDVNRKADLIALHMIRKRQEEKESGRVSS